MPGPSAKKIVIPPLYEKTPPGKDFYWHVNRNWHKLTHIPSWSSSFGVSEEIEEQVDAHLYKILDSAPATTPLGIFTHSALIKSAQKNSVATLKRIIHSFDCIRGPEDIARTLAEFALYRMNCLFTAFIVEQEEEAHKNRLYLTAGKLGLPDRSYYAGQAPGKTRTMLSYTHMLEKCCELLEIPKGVATAFVQLEASLADPMDKANYDDDVPIKVATLEHDYAAIPFGPFFETLQLKTDRIVIGSRRWMRMMDKLFRTWTLDNWRAFFTGSIILHALPVLPPPFDDLHFEFFGKRMKDQLEKVPQKRLALLMAKEWLPVTLSREFVREHFGAAEKSRALAFVQTLVAAAKERVGETEWLEPATRRRAQKKLDAMDLGVAYPDKWPEVAAVELDPANFLENILKLGRAMTLEDLENEGKRSQRASSWDDPAFAVNAFYYSGGNGLIMPAGILQWPFWGGSAAWSYGALGAAVGHEMTHAFDMDGKNYDERGFLEPWWTVGDNRRYMKKARELVELFNEADYMGRRVNGALTLSENIADLGGLGIALRALENTGLSGAKRKEALRDFFWAYAVSWRTRERKQKAYQSLIIDRHAPPTLRVNLIVAQFDAWYEAFDIGESSPLWIPPEKRIRIF